MVVLFMNGQGLCLYERVEALTLPRTRQPCRHSAQNMSSFASERRSDIREQSMDALRCTISLARCAVCFDSGKMMGQLAASRTSVFHQRRIGKFSNRSTCQLGIYGRPCTHLGRGRGPSPVVSYATRVTPRGRTRRMHQSGTTCRRSSPSRSPPGGSSGCRSNSHRKQPSLPS